MAQITVSNYSNNLFSNHFLEERIQDREEWNEVDFEEKFDELREFYQEKKEILSENLNEDQTQENFIDPILRKLGHAWVTEASKRVGSRKDGKTLNPDYAFMSPGETPKVHRGEEEALDVEYAVGDAKSWGLKLDKSSQDHTNPAFQIYNYVDRLRADWGILTNGKKWRLYSYEDCAADIYFEIDLENLLAGEKTEEKLEAFKYFYLFFRAKSFEGDFLAEVYQESVKYAEGLEDDLEDKVYDALEVAVEGFFETNDIEKTEENIDLVHHASLIFLYRVLFILNAESRDLLPVENDIYQDQLSFEFLKEQLLSDEESNTFPENTWLWQERISNLFEAINNGRDYGDFEIPAYNGGLFDDEETEENKFLAEKQLQGDHLKEILDLLATTKVEDEKVLVDYKDLNIRHLGSVYEGLLEHEFKAADQRKILENGEWKDFSKEDDWEEVDEDKRVEEGELYLTNESGERKATGSYYTPEYIVEYIVKNTVGPKVEEKISEAEENDEKILPKVLELNVVDPAMGSGHFLTEATEFIAEHIVEHADLKNQDIDQNEDELNWAKRQVVQNCIYGVDINPLAVELGKLSLWIETMAEGKPLNFLDHHLKHGNSLIGSDFNEIFSHPTEKQKRLDSEDFNFSPEEARDNFQRQYLEIEQMPENTVKQIHEKEQAYKQFISNNVLYQQFQQLANIHTRQYFEKEANSSDYESFLINIGNPGNPFENTKWYKNAQQDAENRNYFHWQLEFPKVFFGQTQGFDAVIGNPPYVASAGRSDISANIHDSVRPYLRDNFEVAKDQFDLYTIFSERAIELTDFEGKMSYIVPDSLLSREQISVMRKYLLENTKIDKLLWAKQVFEGVESGNSIFVASKSQDIDENHQISCFLRKNDELEGERNEISQEYFLQNDNYRFDLKLSDAKIEVIKKVEGVDAQFETFADVKRGEEIGKRSDKITGEGEPIISGTAIQRYSVDPNNYLFIDPDEIEKEERYYQEEKLVYRQTGGEIRGAFDEEGVYSIKSVYNCITDRPFNLMGVTNSSLIEFYHDLTEGGYRDVFPQLNQSTLEALPVPEKSSEKLREKTKETYESKEAFLDEKNSFLEWVEAEWGVDVDDLSLKTHLREYWEYDFDEFMRVAKKNKSQIDGSVKSREFRELMKEEWESSMDTLRPLMQEIDELENEIDAIVFDLYDLTEEEVETVLDSLDTGDKEKERILEKFEEVKN
ncbi:MAG: Eco57I restriction-modification methylase domain-containing protein [Candidatus Nanohalobium sp.]